MEQFFFPSEGIQKVLFLFFSRPGENFYLREIADLTSQAVGSLQRQLTKLEKNRILKSVRKGMLKYYQFDETYPYMEELKSIVSREMRRMKLEKNVQKLLRVLKKEYHPEKIILFGSLPTGRVTPSSDVDLCIVKKNIPKRYWDRVKELAPILSENTDVGVDYVIWTTEEFNKEISENNFLKEEILKKGKILYECTV